MREHIRNLVARQSGEEVDLGYVCLDDADLEAIQEYFLKVDACNNPILHTIDLTKGNLTRRSARILAEIPSLTTIHIGANNLGDEGARILLEKPELKFLDLRGNGLTRRVKALIEKREAEGVQILKYDNRYLEYGDNLEDYVQSELDLDYALSFVRFRAPTEKSSTSYFTGWMKSLGTFFNQIRKCGVQAEEVETSQRVLPKRF